MAKTNNTLYLRDSAPVPTLTLDPGVKNLFDIRPHHFELTDYDPHPAMLDIPVAI